MHAGEDHTHGQKVPSILASKPLYLPFPIQHGLSPTGPSPQLVNIDEHVFSHTVGMLLLARLA